MRQITSHARSPVLRQKRTAIVPTLGTVTARSLIAPPQLSREIPSQLQTIDHPKRIGTLGCALHKLGLLQWNGNLVADVETSLKAYAHSISIPMLEGFYELTLTDDFDRNMSDNGWHDGTKQGGLGLNSITDQPLLFDPRKTVRQLERILPRLGYTVLDCFEHTLAKLTGCCGPSQALYIAEYNHWRGYDNEATARAEIAEEDDIPPEDIEFELTRAEFDKDFPPDYFNGKHLTESELANAKVPKRLQPLIEATLEFMKWDLLNDVLNINESDRCDSFILYWNPEGMVGRLYDERINDLYNSGSGHTYAMLTAFDPDQEESIITAFKNMQTLIARLTHAVGVLPLLATQILPNA